MYILYYTCQRYGTHAWAVTDHCQTTVSSVPNSPLGEEGPGRLTSVLQGLVTGWATSNPK